MEIEKKPYFEEAKDLITDYVEDRLLLIKMQAAEKAAEFAASVFKGIIIGLLSIFILIIVSFLAGYYLSQLTGSIFYGFGILLVVYVVLVLLLLYLHKKYFNRYITDKVIAMIFSK